MSSKINQNILTLIKNCILTRERSIFVIFGNQGKNLITKIFDPLSKNLSKNSYSVLWCYAKKLYLSSHKKKRAKQIKSMTQRGLIDSNHDPFVTFISRTNIRYCYYSETTKILGNTFDMCILQDFDEITPNILARTIESIEGGGSIILLINNFDSFSQFQNLNLGSISRSESVDIFKPKNRFDQRFILSLASNPNCLIIDDELNLLNSHHLLKNSDIKSFNDSYVQPSSTVNNSFDNYNINNLPTDLGNIEILISMCKTSDQAEATINFLNAASIQSNKATLVLTAPRSRGKSACLGLSVAGSLAMGLKSIFVSSPTPENVRSFFEFTIKGLESLGYREQLDYNLVEETSTEWSGSCIVQININKSNHQVVQYIRPQHYAKLYQVELLVIDEAAAIPISIVNRLIGPYLVFICSTSHGYEGTGRSLSLQLILELRKQQSVTSSSSERVLKEIKMAEPIRYASGDKVESWLDDLLFLDSTSCTPRISKRLPYPHDCELVYINRDMLFTYTKISELLLQTIMSIYMASQYEKTPDDILLISDAPMNHILALIDPTDKRMQSIENIIPDIMAVVHLAYEGAISVDVSQKYPAHGTLNQEKCITDVLCQYFQTEIFKKLSVAKIVRIAVHPEFIRIGYGTRTVDLLKKYFMGDFSCKDEKYTNSESLQATADSNANIQKKDILHSLVLNLAKRPNETINYFGVHYELNVELMNFWLCNGFKPIYLQQDNTEINLAGQKIIMIKTMNTSTLDGCKNWSEEFQTEFRKRLIYLLAGKFRKLPSSLALLLLMPKLQFRVDSENYRTDICRSYSTNGIYEELHPHDIKRLQLYITNSLTLSQIDDLIPILARAFFLQRIPIDLSFAQATIVLCLGLQYHDVSKVKEDLKLTEKQISSLFKKFIKKVIQNSRDLKSLLKSP